MMIGPKQSERHVGFTLVEVLIAMAIIAMAASALLLGMTTSTQSTGRAMRETIARGIAEQLMDEILGMQYSASGQIEDNLGASSRERNGDGRSLYNDIDDFNRFETETPEDRWGIALGMGDGEGDTRLAALQAPQTIQGDWKTEVEIYFVDPDDPQTRSPAGQETSALGIEVSVIDEAAQSGPTRLVRLRRVVPWIPPLP